MESFVLACILGAAGLAAMLLALVCSSWMWIAEKSGAWTFYVHMLQAREPHPLTVVTGLARFLVLAAGMVVAAGAAFYSIGAVRRRPNRALFRIAAMAGSSPSSSR